MEQIDLKLFEKNIEVTLLQLSDYDKVVELQLKCFSGMKPWSIEQFTSQLTLFSEGQVCVKYQGTIVASSSSLILDFCNVY